ncbi:hypothetical protein MMC22_007167 [Lobaria immixta]|nr:hypothetical protein [Lobaria immixta]
MVAGRDQAYSTLEVVRQEPRYQADRQWKPPPSDPGKQVDPDCEKQYVENNGGLELAAQKDQIDVRRIPARRFFTRKRIIICGAIGLILILAAVLGGIFGSRHKSSATASLSSPSNSSATSPSAAPIQRNIAAVSFTSNSANNTRVYFQDDVGQIIEASNSAGNSTWSVKKTGIGAKNGSAIAAAVSRPNLPFEITILYLDEKNLIHDIIYNVSTGAWTSGTLSAQAYTAMPNSSLSAMYNWCRLCVNTTIITFQDENGFVQVGNFTSDGWTLTQLGQDLEPELGTGLALHPFYRVGLEDQINLYYQKSVLNMALASWTPAFNKDSVDSWALSAQIYDPIPSGSPIAAASSYSNVSTGFETWIEVLSLSNTGVEVNTWSGAKNHWLSQNAHPSVMANSTSNTKIYGSLAVTAIGNAFAVVRTNGQADVIESWQVADDTMNWSLIGNVSLNGAWG